MRSPRRTAALIGTGLVLLSAACLAVAGCSKQEPTTNVQSGKQPTAGSDQPVRVKTVRPTREPLKRLSTPQPAQVGAYEKTDIYSRATGYLESLGEIKGANGEMRPVDIGDRVSKGQVLAKLSVPEMEQERLQKAALVDQAEADVGQAEASVTAAAAMVEAATAKVEETKAELAYRNSDYELQVTLVKERAARSELQEIKLNQLRAAEAAHATSQANIKVAQARLVQAKADVTSAKARLKVAEANREQAVIMLSYATIKAPYEGIVTRRLVDTGAFIQAGVARSEPLFTVARVDRLRIVADIPEAEASLIKIGQSATFRVTAARAEQLSGKVVRFADALDSGTRTMRTEVELDAPGKSLRPGMFGSLTILLVDSPNALMLPTSTLLTGGGKPAVLVVEDGKAHRREVELGLNEGGRVQVISGLTGNEQVIAEGKGTVRDGQDVEVAP